MEGCLEGWFVSKYVSRSLLGGAKLVQVLSTWVNGTLRNCIFGLIDREVALETEDVCLLKNH